METACTFAELRHQSVGATAAQGHGIADIIAEVLAQQPELVDSPRTPPRQAERTRASTSGMQPLD